MTARAPMCLLACDDAVSLVEAVGRRLSIARTPSHDVWFSCGEGKHIIETNLRGADVYLFQQPVVPGGARSVYDRFVMLLHAVDAARFADADRITVVVPYLPGSRQDKRKGHVREGVSTGLFARMMESAGVDMVVTVEPHNEAIIGCYDPSRTVFEAVTVCRTFARFLEHRGWGCQVVASTDVGGLEMARTYAKALGCGLAALSKERDYTTTSTVATTSVIGDVAGRSVLLVDDIVDTASSVASAVRALWDQGATDVSVAAVHMVLSGAGWDRLRAVHTEAETRGLQFRVAGTSSVVHHGAPDWFVSCALDGLLADVIRSVNQRGSVREVEGR